MKKETCVQGSGDTGGEDIIISPKISNCHINNYYINYKM